MDSGNWVPIDKKFVSALPVYRPYTELEAAFSLAVDYDNGKNVSISGLSRAWGWSRKKTSNFLARIGVEITGSCKGSHLGGEIKPQEHEGLHEGNMKGTSGGHFKFNKNGGLQDKKNMKGTSGEHEGDMKGSTTIYPNTNPNISFTEKVPGNGQDGEFKLVPPPTGKPKEKIPYEEIVEAYNEILASLGAKEVRKLTDGRRRKIKKHWKENKNLRDVSKWRDLFTLATTQDYLLGKNKYGWVVNFDFIMKDDNITRIIEQQFSRGGGAR